MEEFSQESDPFTRYESLIHLSNQTLSFLDYPLDIANKMPLELFLEDYREHVAQISQEVLSRKEGDQPNLRAKAYQHQVPSLGGNVSRIPVEVFDFDHNTKKFAVKFESPEGSKVRHAARLNL